MITSKPISKLKRTNSIVAYFEYFCQMVSKSIRIILRHIVSKLVHFFLRHSVNKDSSHRFRLSERMRSVANVMLLDILEKDRCEECHYHGQLTSASEPVCSNVDNSMAS